ncbi:hormogonium polysaccharide biosynthesis protein HpsL [Myxacorys almedinensis]|uniref:Bacterial cell division membrane protein n=1 Tax=Myxacorys almedinensis A TaxID=2690445 RepID=A0A8J8CHW3_9CYAN|nr:hormogonium polysaccharide biosynthesis protein HpsL [Myxacorys almedinensis]NDJ15861.1 hypothetical protein [Myxacorys almedinensis A]
MPKPKRLSKPASPTEPTLSLKEQLVQKRKEAQARKEAIGFISMTVMVAIALSLMLAIVGGVKGAIGGFVAIVAILLSFKFPWQALYAFLIYMPFGGTITYAVGGDNPLFQLAKDGLFIPALIGVVQYCKQQKLPLLVVKSLTTPFALLLGYCLLVLLFVNGAQQFAGLSNQASIATDAIAATVPNEKPIAMGILGLKVLVGYVPLIPCAYYLMRKKQDVYWLMRMTAIIVIVCCGLAFLQYMFLKTGRCEGTVGSGAALFKASLSARCLVGGSLLYSEEQGVIRLPGTFVAPWQWGWFLISSAFFSFAVTFFDRNFLWKIIGGVALLGTMIMAVLCGQRIALMLVPAMIVLQLITTGQVANLKRFIPIGIGVTLVLFVAMVSNPDVVQERWDSAVGRWNASPPDSFIVQQFENVSKGTSLLGKGLGRATNSARALGETELIETYYPKVMFEIGPIGALLFLGVATSLTGACFKAYQQVRDRNLRGYGASLWTFVLFISYNTYYYPLDVDPVAVYYWFFAGIVLRLPYLDQQEPIVIEDANSKKKKKKQK